MPKSRIFLFLLLTFAAGVAVRSFIPVYFPALWFGIAAGASIALFGVFRRRKKTTVFGFLIVMFALGILRFEMSEREIPNLSPYLRKQMAVEGLVAADPEVTYKVQRFEFLVQKVDGRTLDQSFLVLVTTGLYPRYKFGDSLSVAGKLEEPENFGDFDYKSYLAKDQIYSTLFFPKIEKTGEGEGNRLKIVLSKIKHAFEDKIDSALPEPHAAFLKGLTLGERESLPEEMVENFARTGVTHIVALSGYNITLVANLILWVLLRLALPFRVAFWLASSGIIIFVLLTGASPSVVRAGIMGILILVAQKEGRLYSIRNALAFAGAVMIMQNPKILRFDAAFQLSFLATLGLIYLSPKVEKWFSVLHSKIALRQGHAIFEAESQKLQELRVSPFKRILVETLSAQIMVLPLLIFLFGRVSLISPLSNLLVILAVPYSMGLGFAIGVLGLIWEPLAKIPGLASWVLLEYKIRVIEFFARFPYASVEVGKWLSLPLALIYGWFGYKLWRNSGKTAK